MQNALGVIVGHPFVKKVVNDLPYERIDREIILAKCTNPIQSGDNLNILRPL